jgi:hypothetical protein
MRYVQPLVYRLLQDCDYIFSRLEAYAQDFRSLCSAHEHCEPRFAEATTVTPPALRRDEDFILP